MASERGKGRWEALKIHYKLIWGDEALECALPSGPVDDLPSGFGVVCFPPNSNRPLSWVYATVCMSTDDDEIPVELHMFSPEQTDQIALLLTVTAHYHRTGAPLGLNHTVNFGTPWLQGSQCDRGFVSLPYIDGPRLEHFEEDGRSARCLWLIPITLAEVEFKKSYGVEALEQRFEACELNYLDPTRLSVAPVN